MSNSSLPLCGRTCINNEIQIAETQYGCGPLNSTCYCAIPNFGYGIRDCANQACQNGTEAEETLSYGTSVCESALPADTSPSSRSTTLTASSASYTATTSTSAVPTASTSPTTTPSPLVHHLSTGDKAGIGVGAAIAALSLLGAALFMVFRRRRLQKRQLTVETGNSVDPEEAAQPYPHELAAAVPHEKDGTSAPGELFTKSNTHEMSEEVKATPMPPVELAAG